METAPPASRRPDLLCVGIRLRQNAKVCTTHIAPHESDKGAQILRMAQLTRFGPQTPVVLMGDFNVTPSHDSLDALYTRAYGGGAHGRFQEVDEGEGHVFPCRCGEPTFDRTLTDPKIDYIFMTARHWESVQGNATYSSYSDHDPVRGAAVLSSGAATTAKT